MSARFIVPHFEKGKFYLLGSNTDGPFTSYVSVLMETGIFGALPLFGIYGWMLLALVGELRRRGQSPRTRMFAAWALTSLLMILGIALVDNYLETTRYTLLAWLTVGIWKIEQHAAAILPPAEATLS